TSTVCKKTRKILLSLSVFCPIGCPHQPSTDQGQDTSKDPQRHHEGGPTEQPSCEME
ncbi:hypothetical protein ATANTOWER_022480, partial [Ataeniobius toweri]|nr:hypothetical protein [Ataeniobius toweri]